MILHMYTYKSYYGLSQIKLAKLSTITTLNPKTKYWMCFTDEHFWGFISTSRDLVYKYSPSKTWLINYVPWYIWNVITRQRHHVASLVIRQICEVWSTGPLRIFGVIWNPAWTSNCIHYPLYSVTRNHLSIHKRQRCGHHQKFYFACYNSSVSRFNWIVTQVVTADKIIQ